MREWRPGWTPQVGSRPSSEPYLTDDDALDRWRAARMAALDHVLAVASEPPFGYGLVLRGSRLLVGWLGADAREPHDLDWVVPFGPSAVADELLSTLDARPAVADGVRLCLEDALVSETWVYRGDPGYQVSVPFTVAGLPGGFVRADLGTDEIGTVTAMTELPRLDGSGTIGAHTVGLGQSLAWKINWLDEDEQLGKDLYDATLLAEFVASTGDLAAAGQLRAAANRWPPGAGEYDALTDRQWAAFAAEYPTITGGADTYRARLTAACTSIVDLLS